jgi:hypothetical protein
MNSPAKPRKLPTQAIGTKINISFSQYHQPLFNDYQWIANLQR